MLTLFIALALLSAGFWVNRWMGENRILRQVIERLSADSRVAEVLVTKSEFDEANKKIFTTIKFLEYDATGKPLPPKYFTFQGNMIQFQALVIRFEDRFVRAGDRLRGKSAFLFLKAFVLDGQNTQVFEITKPREIPSGYKVVGGESPFEARLWAEFWNYALDPQARHRAGVKNAQLEAPGSSGSARTVLSIRMRSSSLM